MAIKPFKLRISRVITSLQSCNSKDTSTLPEDPVPSFLIRQSSPPPNNHTKHITTVDFPVTAPSNNIRRSSSALKRHLSSALISVGCGLTSRAGSTRNSGDRSTRSRPPQEFKWREEEKWHVVANIYDETQPRRKIYSSDENDAVLALPPPPPPSAAKKKKRRSRKKKTATFRISTSSADESGLFSNDELEETETLVSSLSTDSSYEFNPKTDYTNRKNRRNRNPAKRAAKRGPLQQTTKIIPSVSSTTSSEEGELPARLSVFKKLIPCSVDGKVKESFAIVKKSRDPHSDFKRSMMEMILEKRMFEKDDLEQLLQCFLSLNARQYHGIIVGAFSEIWEDLFCNNNANNVISSSPRMSAYRRRTPSCS